MNSRILLLCILILPSLVNAEIYKWIDTNGAVRYSDVPPPSNMKQEALYGKKVPKPTGLAPLAAVAGDATVAANKDKAASAKDKPVTNSATVDKNKAPADKTKADKTPPLSKEESAAKRAKDAERQKKVDEAKQADLKIKEANCKSSKSNLATYTNGGRITKTNEKGEREYLTDADITKAKADSQKDVEKYCD